MVIESLFSSFWTISIQENMRLFIRPILSHISFQFRPGLGGGGLGGGLGDRATFFGRLGRTWTSASETAAPVRFEARTK